jgi:hypothetical protein
MANNLCSPKIPYTMELDIIGVLVASLQINLFVMVRTKIPSLRRFHLN